MPPATEATTPLGAAGGAGGGAGGVSAAEGADAGPVPTLLVAVTVNVYAVPSVSPVTSTLVTPFVVAVAPPGLAVTVYPVIAAPPFEAGADQWTLTNPSPGVPPTP